MSTEFTPIFLFLLVAIGTAAGMLGVSAVFGPSKETKVKQMPYESGMNPFGDARQRFDVRYYLIAIVFLLFDVELLFLYPWAVASYRPANEAAKRGIDAAVQSQMIANREMVFWGVAAFFVLLLAGYIYDWRKGVFRWR